MVHYPKLVSELQKKSYKMFISETEDIIQDSDEKLVSPDTDYIETQVPSAGTTTLLSKVNMGDSMSIRARSKLQQKLDIIVS
jgi:hypothetical protein